MIKLTIDNEEVEAKKGQMVLAAAEENGIYIPTLCADHDLKPHGACRVCVVEIEGTRGLPTACTTPVAAGMVVRTESPAIEKARRLAVELVRSDHPIDCNACPKNNQCDLQMMEAVLGISGIRMHSLGREMPTDSSNPFFSLDRNYCILCAKCVRSCDEICGVEAITLAGRGHQRRVSTFADEPWINSNCQYCGECVDHCPVFALSAKDTRKAEEEKPSVCPYCGVGCGINLGTRHDIVLNTHGREENTVNNKHLCVRGRFGIAEFIHSTERILKPQIRKEGKLVDATWDEALALVAQKLGNYKGESVGVIASDKCSNEDNYILQKFGRAVLGTDNINHPARLAYSPAVDGVAQCFGLGAMTNSITDISAAACIFVFGTNPTYDNPVIGEFIKKAARASARLIVANPREIDLVRFAHVWLRYKPGSEAALLLGMMRVILDEGLADKAFIQSRCENFDTFEKSVKTFDLSAAVKATGISADAIAEATRLYASRKPAAILYGAGVIQSFTENTATALADLAMLTGNIGKPGSGVNALLGQNNEQGAADMGALPGYLPGYQPISDAAVKAKFESAWGATLNLKPGLTVPEMLQAAARGQIKALYVVGEDPALGEPDTKAAREALGKVEFLVVQDLFRSETAKMAHVVLPAASFAEKDGTFTNTDRRVQLSRKAVDTVGISKADWWITCLVAQKMGAKGFEYSEAAEVMKEIAGLTPIYGGISHERLEKSGLQWPCPTPDHPGTPVLYTEAFARGKGKFLSVAYQAAEISSAEFPFVLMTGQHLFHRGTGARTRKVKGIRALRAEDLLEINPSDAQKLGIADGETVRVASKTGELVSKVKVTEASPVGAVYMTGHSAEKPLNMLTSAAFDPVTKSAPRLTAVRIEKTK